MPFEGFPDGDAKFFEKLAKNNQREWFMEHKSEYEEGWHAPMVALLAEVRERIDPAYERCELDEPKVFRIYRDVRFSKDKTPYKTHVGGFVPLARKGKKKTDLPMALYFHVGADRIFGAAGHYMMERESLERFRAAVADDARGKELTRILGALSKKKYEIVAHDRAKRVPKGYAPDHRRAELLTYKGLTVTFPAVPKAALTSKKLVPWLADACKKSAPLVDWLALATA